MFNSDPSKVSVPPKVPALSQPQQVFSTPASSPTVAMQTNSFFSTPDPITSNMPPPPKNVPGSSIVAAALVNAANQAVDEALKDSIMSDETNHNKRSFQDSEEDVQHTAKKALKESSEKMALSIVKQSKNFMTSLGRAAANAS